MLPTTIIFYHGSDNDGFCSGALVKMRIPSSILYPVTYSVFKKNEIEYLKKRVKKKDTVYICDFSFSPNGFFYLINDLQCSVIWLDHHISAINKIKESPILKNTHIQGIRDINYAGCELTWKYLYNNQEIHPVVKMLGRYDVWDHEHDENILYFQNGISQYDVNPVSDRSLWDILIPVTTNHLVLDYSEKIFKQIINEGKVITRYATQQNKLKCFSAFSCSFKEEQFKDYKIIGVFGGYGSLTFESIWNNQKYDIMFTANYNGENWNCSLYTDKDIDVSVVASFFEGGGHKKASGFFVPDVFNVFDFHGKLSNINKTEEPSD